MKKAMAYTLALSALLTGLAGCGNMGLLDGDRMPGNTAAPAVSASPAVVTPDMEDGIVRDEDGIITDDDTGAATPRAEAGRKDEGTTSASPSASPAE